MRKAASHRIQRKNYLMQEQEARDTVVPQQETATAHRDGRMGFDGRKANGRGTGA
jgi:hypothetical protein